MAQGSCQKVADVGREYDCNTKVPTLAAGKNM
jgi:hypothetical protein